MNISELISVLEDFAEENPDANVKLAMQPNYPFEYSIGDIIKAGEDIFLSEGHQIGYLKGEVRNELGW